MFLAAIGFSACNEDFKDWADPQSNPQEESAGQLTATSQQAKTPASSWMRPQPIP